MHRILVVSDDPRIPGQYGAVAGIARRPRCHRQDEKSGEDPLREAAACRCHSRIQTGFGIRFLRIEKRVRFGAARPKDSDNRRLFRNDFVLCVACCLVLGFGKMTRISLAPMDGTGTTAIQDQRGLEN